MKESTRFTLISLALQHGVDYRDAGGRTPLMYAVQGNQPKMCEVLLKLKANVNAKDLAGLTPLLVGHQKILISSYSHYWC